MATEYNPSFEDMYPVNDDALFEDFRDALVIFIDRIKNLCNNVISNSAFSELSIAHTHLCKLGMPSEKVMGKRQIRAWKKLLMEIDSLEFMYFFDTEHEMHGQLQIGTSESGDIICEAEKGDIPDSWHEDKNKLTQFLAEKLEKLEIYREMIEARQSNVQADPKTKGQVKMDTQTINTPEKLRQAIAKFLQSNYSHENLVETYKDAFKCLARLWVDYSELPAFPTCKDNPSENDLRDIMDWCDKASKVVDDIVYNLKRQTIDKMISLFKNLRGFADEALSLVDKKLQNETRAKCEKKKTQEQDRINAEIDRSLKAAQKTRGGGSGIRIVVGSPLVCETQIGADFLKDKGYILPEESDKAVQSYLSKDPTFNDKLSQLKNEINKVYEEINKLAGNNTPDGELIDIYCKLKDIPLEQQYDELHYSFADTADIILGNGNRIYTSIDNVIKTLEEIQIKAGTVQGNKAVKEANDNDTVPPPIDKNLWDCPNLKKLREIDSNTKRDGITGDKQAFKRLKEYTEKRGPKRKDIAETLYPEDGRIKTTMPHRSMFKQK